MNNKELELTCIDFYVILQQIKSDPSKLDYYLAVYEGKLNALGIPLENFKVS